MSLRIIFLAYAIGSLLLIAACHRGGGGECGGNKYGGPYPKYADFEKEVRDEKLADFALYNGLGLGLSDTYKLAGSDMPDLDDVFETSVKANNLSVTQQRYNYVITDNCDILVAVWNANANLSKIVDGVACAGGEDFPLTPQPKMMIDFAAEALSPPRSLKGPARAGWTLTEKRASWTRSASILCWPRERS